MIQRLVGPPRPEVIRLLRIVLPTLGRSLRTIRVLVTLDNSLGEICRDRWRLMQSEGFGKPCSIFFSFFFF